MKKYTKDTAFQNTPKLASLLAQRRSPLLMPEAMRKVLEELTEEVSMDTRFFLACFPENTRKKEIDAGSVMKVDIMMGDDNEKYMPVFSSIEKLQAFKPKMKKGEAVYIAAKKDLLDFLEVNSSVAACVLNPTEDDLLLYRVNLKNLIAVEQERNGL